MKPEPPKRLTPGKRIRDRDELAEQARLFGQDWHAGDRVQTWLVRHEGKPGELSQMVEDGWSWTDIGRAMHIAGITYRTGEPISAAVLRKKASEARSAVRAKSAKPQDTVCPNVGAPMVVPAQQQTGFRPTQPFVPPSASETDFPVEDEEPEFKPISLLNWSGKLITDEEKQPKKEPVPAPKIDVAAVLAKFTGRK